MIPVINARRIAPPGDRTGSTSRARCHIISILSSETLASPLPCLATGVVQRSGDDEPHRHQVQADGQKVGAGHPPAGWDRSCLACGLSAPREVEGVEALMGAPG